MFFVLFLCHQLSVPVSLSFTCLLMLSCLYSSMWSSPSSLCCLHPPVLTCPSLELGFFLVAELFLTHVPAFMFLLHFLHSQNLRCIHIPFLVCTCTFSDIILSTALHMLMRTVFCTDASSTAYPSFLLPIIWAFVSVHPWARTYSGHTRYPCPLRPTLSLPLEPARHMHISEVSSTFPGQWEVCSGAPLLRRKPVLALPSRVCHWALTLELKQPLLLVVAGLTCGCLPSVTCTDAVVNAEPSWVCDFLPKKERSWLSQSWQKRDIPLTPVS